MRRVLANFLFIIVIIIIILLLSNINVNTQRCVNYQCQTIMVPLYLKILDFFDRHYNYKQLVKIIIRDTKTDQQRAMEIFEWTYKNLKKVPPGLPVIDDHVWYIIVRGYGVSDQFCDVFTTLCNYAGLESFYLPVYTADQTESIPLSFVQIEEKWCVFDPYRGIYFKDKQNNLADIKVLKSGMDWNIAGWTSDLDVNYAVYFINLPLFDKAGLKRANIQSPLRRFIFEIKKWKKRLG